MHVSIFQCRVDPEKNSGSARDQSRLRAALSGEVYEDQGSKAESVISGKNASPTATLPRRRIIAHAAVHIGQIKRSSNSDVGVFNFLTVTKRASAFSTEALKWWDIM
jgi:hypothetical protein